MEPSEDALGELRQLFQKLDRNGCGVIEQEALSNLLQALDAKTWTDQRIERLFDAADLNRDGGVDYDEFLAFVSGDEVGRSVCRELLQAGCFRGRNVPGLRITPASDEDADLTRQLVASEAFHGGDGDGLEAVRAYTAVASLGQREWRVNVAAVQCPPGLATGRVALFMHGHGPTCCMSTWGRFWAPMLRRGYHVLAFDAPGFGRSEGATCQTIAWREWDADLVLTLLRAFGARGQGRVTVFGQCMGGAMFLRALQKSAETFAAKHVLHNCTIGTWPQQLPDILRGKGGGIVSFWWCDPDHMREANVYREFTSLMAKSPELCTFVDLQRDRELPAFFSFARVPEPRLARGEDAVVLGYCPQAVFDLVAFATSPPRALRARGADAAPKKTMLQLGLENKDFKVFVRLRPPLVREAGAEPCCFVHDVEDPRGRQVQQILLQRPDTEVRQPSSEFVFERVFRPEATQDEVWAALRSSLDVVGALLEGVGATVFAYGQTGSGKTHTIDGDGTGIIARVVRDLYGRVQPDQQVGCQYVQLYNEDFLDLLAPPARVSQDGRGGLVGARTLKPATADELLRSVRAGAAYRASAKTDMNDTSSRSHAILNLFVLADAGDVAAGSSGSASAAAPQLFVVDLAGSERVKRSGVTGARFEEAVAINQSLLALSNVTTALVENNGRPRAHIPYRDSALTQLLRNSLGGAARTALIACASLSADSAEETLGTLRFAGCATHVQNRATKIEREAKEAEDDRDLDDELEGHEVDFANGQATVPTSSGGIHCFGNISASTGSPVVVMLHYYGKDVNGSMWQFMFEGLTAAGCRYLAPDLPGHGQSPGESSSKPEDFTKEGGPVDIVRQLLDACGVKKAVLMGYDWGGGIACAFAAKHPKRTQKVIAWCAASLRDPQELEKLQRRGKKGDILLLWAKNDNWHPWRKGAELAGALGARLVEVKVRYKGGQEEARARALEFLAACASD